MKTINEIYDEHGLHKWWQEDIDDPDAVYNNLPQIVDETFIK